MESALRHLAEDGRGLGSGPPPPSTPAAPAGIHELRRSFQEQRELGMDGAWSWSRPSPGPHALPQRHPWADPASLPPASRPAGLRAPRQSSVARCSLRGACRPAGGRTRVPTGQSPPNGDVPSHAQTGCTRRASWLPTPVGKLGAGGGACLPFGFRLPSYPPACLSGRLLSS